jgi:putative copper resistance protein D
VTDPLTLVRSVHFAATVLTVGTVGFLALVAEPADTKGRAGFAALRRQLNLLIWLALAVAILSGAAWLVLLASDILGAPIVDVCLHGGAWPVLLDTRFGLVWCARLALVLLLGLLILWTATRAFQHAAALDLIASLALVGHAGATPGTAGNFHLISDMVHLLAAGAWLGGLPAFALLLWRTRRIAEPTWHDFVIRVTRRFSVLGILSVGALLTSGLINSWNLLGGPRDLVTTDYGRLVALKIALFAAMVAIAAVNRLYLMPRLPEPGSLRSLQRNSLAEVCLGLCVLLFVGTLGTLPPTAHVHPTPAVIPPGAAFVHIHVPEVIADVTVSPGRVGRAEVSIRVVREDFSPFPAKDVRLALEPPTPANQTLEQNAIEQADGSWLVNDIPLGEPGIWTVRVIVTPKRGESIPLDAPIVVER